jgi:hypothetical protein
MALRDRIAEPWEPAPLLLLADLRHLHCTALGYHWTGS